MTAAVPMVCAPILVSLAAASLAGILLGATVYLLAFRPLVLKALSFLPDGKRAAPAAPSARKAGPSIT